MGMFSPRRDIIHKTMKPKNWLNTVPMAVPRMPNPKVNMNSGTSTTLSTAPDIMPYIAWVALPWKRIWLLITIEAVINGAPNRITPMNCMV